MKKKLLTILCLLVILFCCLGFLFYGTKKGILPNNFSPDKEIKDFTEISDTQTSLSKVSWKDLSGNNEVEATPESTFEEYDIHLMAVGDNLIHMGIVYSGRRADGTFNYNFLFDDITEYINRSDIKIINQETPLAGNTLGFSGYPLFNSPTEVGDAIVNAGFNVVLSASNHSSDQGISGIDNIVSYWKQHPEISMVGLHEPTDDCNMRIKLLTIKDVTFAILNFTYGPNYGSASSDLSSRMDILCAKQSGSDNLDFTSINPTVLQDISTAKNLADVVIVCPHWGTEYTFTPSSYQEKFALQMTEAGADVIIGTHPHVPEPVCEITAGNGNKSLCYYSLGNFVSTQQKEECMLEEMAWITFHVNENGPAIDTSKTGVLPLVCHYTANPVRLKDIYPLEDYTEELAISHGINTYEGISFHLSDLQQWSQEIIGDWILTKEQILTQ